MLASDTQTLQANYDNLKKIGLTDKKIASQPNLLVMNQETTRTKYQKLREMGLTDTRIASQPSLLGRNTENIKGNYDFLVGLFRKDYTDRGSGRDLILNNPGLLANSRVTVESSVQFLHSLGIDYLKNPLMLNSTAQNKRKKMAWMLREVFDYREAPQEKKKDLIHSTQGFRKRPT